MKPLSFGAIRPREKNPRTFGFRHNVRKPTCDRRRRRIFAGWARRKSIDDFGEIRPSRRFARTCRVSALFETRREIDDAEVSVLDSDQERRLVGAIVSNGPPPDRAFAIDEPIRAESDTWENERMRITRVGRWVLFGIGLTIGLGAAPATSSHDRVDKVIQRIRADWNKPGAKPQPNAPGWNIFFDALQKQFQAYAAASEEDERYQILARLNHFADALQGIGWQPAVEVREELREWLRPRVRLAWAQRGLIDRIKRMPPTNDAAVKENREKWVGFVDNSLGTSLRAYEGAATVLNRQRALRLLQASIDELQKGNRQHPWEPSIELEQALNSLYNLPNVDITADVNVVSPYLNRDVVMAGPIWFKGQLSQVTPGPKTGFGLLPYEGGVAFYNSQLMTSITPIRGFNQQLANDPRGRKLLKLYSFGATTRDDAELTITAVLRPSGITITPSYRHNVNAAIGSVPVQGGGLGRAVLALIGLNENKIDQKVYQQALPRMRSEVASSALELGAIKTNQAAAEENQKLSKFLVGNDTLEIRDIQLKGLSLRSQPQYVQAGGLLTWKNAPKQRAADLPQPSNLHQFSPGVAADLHLGSVLSNVGQGVYLRPEIADVENLMLVTHKLKPGDPASKAITLTKNVDFPTYLKTVEETGAKNDPSTQALRLKRPKSPPDFSADSRGYLIAHVPDFQLDVPAPPGAQKGGIFGAPTKVYRIASPLIEVALSYRFHPAGEGKPAHVEAHVQEIDFGPDAVVSSINNDEAKAAPVSVLLRAGITSALTNQLRQRPIDVPLESLNIPKFALTSVSDLDPSGWARVILTPTASPNPNAVPTPSRTAPSSTVPSDTPPSTPTPTPNATPDPNVHPTAPGSHPTAVQPEGVRRR